MPVVEFKPMKTGQFTQMTVVRGLIFTLQGELFGQLDFNVHSVLEPGELWAGDALGVAAQAGCDTRLSGLTLWINSDDRRN